jgi:hypothetical protein
MRRRHDGRSDCLYRDVAAEMRAAFRPSRDNWKLASHNVAGFPRKNEVRPERTMENGRFPPSLRDKNILRFKTQPLRSWLISFAASRLWAQFAVN